MFIYKSYFSTTTRTGKFISTLFTFLLLLLLIDIFDPFVRRNEELSITGLAGGCIMVGRGMIEGVVWFELYNGTSGLSVVKKRSLVRWWYWNRFW